MLTCGSLFRVRVMVRVRVRIRIRIRIKIRIRRTVRYRVRCLRSRLGLELGETNGTCRYGVP